MVVLVLRLLLAGVFALAAVGKVLDLSGSRRALVDFGVPVRMAALLGTALPGVELLIAVALLVQPVARAGAGGALVLLLVFVGVIARIVRAGGAPQCHCFGRVGSEPAGRSTLVRNLVLAAAAAVALAAGPGRSLASLSGESVAVLLAALAAGLVMIVGGMRLARGARVPGRGAGGAPGGASPSGAERGRWAPEVWVLTLDGQRQPLSGVFGQGTPAVLLQVSPQCPPCHSLMRDVRRWRRTLVPSLTLITVSSGSVQANREFAHELAIDELLLSEGRTVAEAFGVGGTPSAVLIDSEGRIAGLPATGPPAIEALIRQALRRLPVAGAAPS
jgi:peroxiredoxin